MKAPGKSGQEMGHEPGGSGLSSKWVGTAFRACLLNMWPVQKHIEVQMPGAEECPGYSQLFLADHKAGWRVPQYPATL